MLTTELIRATVRNGTVHPSYLDASSPAYSSLASEMVATCSEHVGHTMGELNESLREIEGASPKFKIARGLAKLLVGRLEVETASPEDPVELRRSIFEDAAQRWASGDLPLAELRSQVLGRAAQRLDAGLDEIERGLYADLKDAQHIVSFDPIDPIALLHRYNVALAQAVLLKAERMEVVVQERGELAPGRFRQLFRYLKFYQLLHTIHTVEHGYRIVIDGPMSLFGGAQKYGFQMACFLPALLLCSSWKLEAKVRWGKSRTHTSFTLDSQSGIQSHLRDRGVYLTEDQRHFVERFQALKTPWELSADEPLLPLGGQSVWIPDYRFVHAEDGREAHLEVLGYWRADYLKRRVKMLAEHGPSNLILAISDKMRVDKDAVGDLPVEVIWYKRALRPRTVVSALESAAR